MIDPDSKASPRRRGFSLIEMLTVLVVLSILMSIGVGALGDFGTSSTLRGAADAAASLTLSARMEATSYGLGSALVIDNGSNPETQYRRMAIVRKEPPTGGSTTPNWVLTAAPFILPEGIYFLPDDLPSKPSGVSFSQGFKKDKLSDGTPAEFKLRGQVKTPCLFYEYDGSGRLIREDESTPFSMVFCKAIRAKGSGTFSFPGNSITGRTGILLRTNGRPAFFKRPEQIDNLAKP